MVGSLDYLTALRSELDAFAACLDADLDAPVEHCGDWTLYDLADHLGRGNLWAAVAVTEKHGGNKAPAAPRERTALVTWFGGTCDTLIATLDTDPCTPAWTFFPPHTVGFWQRRRSLETLVHRWDAEHALGIRGDVDPVLAGDGVAEVVDTMAPRQIARGRASAPRHAVRFTATDTASSWVLGPGDPVATVRAPAADLLLMLWGRISAEDPAIAWDGDRAVARAVLDEPLLP